MCELFGASAAEPVGMAHWFAPFRRRGGGVADNPDGWGVASWDSGKLRTEKAPEAGATSVRFGVLARALRSELLIAHVRKARHPPVPGMQNTHPFAHTCCGREWVFAHNGLVPEVISRDTGGELCKPLGETDSEHAFCHLLHEIATCYEGAGDREWMQRLAERADAIAALGKFNFLLSDGAYLIAYGHDQLHYLDHPDGRDDLSLVATSPLTPDPWRRFARGEIRVYRAGLLALRLRAGASTAVAG
ncbi:MAG: class II glutamine amidotransferase [Pseudomonadota bacterium]